MPLPVMRALRKLCHDIRDARRRRIPHSSGRRPDARGLDSRSVFTSEFVAQMVARLEKEAAG
jgi:hypothetical protein